MDFAGQVTPPAAQAIQMMWDRNCVQDILHRYCHSLDRRDFALMATCFHPRATMDYLGDITTSDEFIAYAKYMAGMLRWTIHQLSNFTLSIEHDMAHTESYVFAYHRIPADAEGNYFFRLNGKEQMALVSCRYLDRFERRDGVWRIAHRVIVGFDNVEYWCPDNGGYFESEIYRARPSGENDPGYQLTRTWRTEDTSA